VKKKNIHKINSLSIVIPFYNEKNRLNLAFKNIKTFLGKKFISKIEILFIDDGSNDSGYLLVNNFFNNLKKSKNLSYKLLRSKKNFGKGYAIKKGCLEAKNKWILTTDLDFSVPLIHVNYWIKKKIISSENDIFFGSRALEKSKVKTAKHRLLIGKIFRVLISFFLSIKIKDTQCGFKLYKNLIAKKIFKKIETYGFDHDLEVVILAKKMNYRIKELPVKWHHVGQSKLHLFKDSIKMFLGILKLSAKI
jgi:dolichyl-phosphate beta-glucosyltransferase